MRFKSKNLEASWVDPVAYPLKGVRPTLAKSLYRKFQMLDAACALKDLRVPPGNRLEALKGDRKDQYSIRVNSRWRVCFVWVDGEAREVEFCDYHA